MTNPQPNSPIYAQPSPDQNRRSCLIAAAIVLVAGLLVIAGIGFGVYKVSELTKSDPKPFPGYGKPKLVKKLAGKWGLYSIPELGIRLALPAKPMPEKPEWSAEHRVVVSGWSNYRLDTDSFGFNIDGYEFRLPYTSEELAEEQKAMYSEMETLKSVEGSTKKTVLGGKDALLQTLTYEQDGYSAITKIYYLNHQSKSVSVTFHYWKEASEVAEEVDRVVKSVAFESP